MFSYRCRNQVLEYLKKKKKKPLKQSQTVQSSEGELEVNTSKPSIRRRGRDRDTSDSCANSHFFYSCSIRCCLRCNTRIIVMKCLFFKAERCWMFKQENNTPLRSCPSLLPMADEGSR